MRGHLPGALLIAAAAIMITGVAIGFLAPSLRDAPPFVEDDIGKAAAAIAGNPGAWAWANGLILTGAILTALALVPISFRFQGPSRPWAWIALVAYAFGAVLGVIDRLISIHVTTWAAPQYPDQTVFAVWEAFSRFDHGLGLSFYILGFIALGLYGVAMVHVEHLRGLGWTFVVVGVAGILLELLGLGIPAYIFLGTAGLGVASWQISGRDEAMASTN